MFDKEFEEKLKESMDTPRNLDFDEGAWASLDQQLEIIGAASGTSSLLGKGLKTAFWGTKSWLSIAAAVILLGTTSFFFYQWQETEKELANEEVKKLENEEMRELGNEGMEGFAEEQVSRFAGEGELGNEEMRELGDEGMGGFADEQVSRFADEGELGNEEIRKFGNEGMREMVNSGQGVEAYKPIGKEEEIVLAEQKQEYVGEEEEKDRLVIEQIPFLSIGLTAPHHVSFAERAITEQVASPNRRIPNSIRFAIIGSLSSMQKDSLQPFKGKTIGFRGEFWFKNNIALYVGVQQQSSVSQFDVQDVDPIRRDFRPLNTPISRNDSLVSADLNKRGLIVPVGFRYVPFQNSHFKLFTGVGVTLQKEIEKEVLLTFFHKKRSSPFPTPTYEYTLRRKEEIGNLKLAYATVEIGTRLKLTQQTELELAYTYQQEIKENTSPYARKRGYNLASGLIFSF